MQRSAQLALQPEFEQKVVHILVRWLLIVLAFHFLALSRTSIGEFRLATKVSYGFVFTNLLLMAAPRRWFSPGRIVNGLFALDFGFVAVSLYFLRESGAQYHWLFILVIGLLGWRRRIRFGQQAAVDGQVW